ncbi:MAG: MFS transporter, partial [Marinovum sp.]|nr:MFS transporter [Marinovum sp.]
MSKSSTMFTPVLIAGCMIILISFLVRASFGVFQIPIAEDFGWLRVEFSLAIAIQNLAWGIGQPIFGALAEKIGDRRAIFAGGLFYAAGLVLSSFAVSPVAHQFYALLIGFGVAGTGFGVILAVVGRASRPEHRSMSLAIATAAGSGGQVIGPPLAEWLLGLMNWPSVFLLFAAAILGSLLILPLMRAPALASKDEIERSMGEVLRHAIRDPSFAMIFFGFFSCGYQLGFISAHF